MKIQKIVMIYETLASFSKLDAELKFNLDGAVRMKLACNLSELGKIAEVYNKERNSLITKLGTPVEGQDGSISVKEDSENYPEFQKQISEMLELDRDVKIDTISKKDILGPNKKNQVPVHILSDLITLEVLVN